MSGRIVEYTVVSSDEVQELHDMVDFNFKRGWKLYGTPFSCNGFICQAMVKEVYPTGKEAAK